MAHRLAWLLEHERWPVGEIDHIDGQRDHNAMHNLRECTHAQNMENWRRPKGRSGRVGVSWHTRNQKWQASIRKDSKHHYLGTFDTVDEAALAYAAAKAQLHTFNPVVT